MLTDKKTRRSSLVSGDRPKSSKSHPNQDTTSPLTDSTGRRRTTRRETITALTAAARAKQVIKQDVDKKRATAAKSVSATSHRPRGASMSAVKLEQQPNSANNTDHCTSCPRHQERSQKLSAHASPATVNDKSSKETPGTTVCRRQSMPPSTTVPTFLKELTDIKSRLQKLEDAPPPANEDSSATSASSPSSVFDRISDSTSLSPSCQSPCARLTVHQRRLRNAFEVMQVTDRGCHNQQFLKAMSSVVNETIAMNQTLWSAIPQDLHLDARSLVSMQKSSDIQLRELTEALYALAESVPTPDQFGLPRPHRRQSHLFHEPPTPPMFPTPLDQCHRYYRSNPALEKQDLTLSPRSHRAYADITNANYSLNETRQPHRQFKAAGILDPQDYRARYYDQRLNSLYN